MDWFHYFHDFLRLYLCYFREFFSFFFCSYWSIYFFILVHPVQLITLRFLRRELAAELEREKERERGLEKSRSHNPSLFRIPIRARWSVSCDCLEHSCRKSKWAAFSLIHSWTRRVLRILEEDTRAPRIKWNRAKSQDSNLRGSNR